METIKCGYCSKKKLFSAKTLEDQKKCCCRIEWLTAVKLFVDWCVSHGLEITLPLSYPSLVIDTLAPHLLERHVSVEYTINAENVIMNDVEYIYNIASKYIIFDDDDDKAFYLDVGCGNMLKTRNVAKSMGAIAYGTDFEDKRISEKTSDSFQHMRGKGQLRFKDNSFLIVTCINFMHHTKHPSYIAQEIYRILDEGGILIMKEMECTSFEDCYYLDYYHHSLSKLIPSATPVGTYRNAHGWREIISAAGLQSTGKIWTSYYENNGVSGSYREYYEVFIKPIGLNSDEENDED